MQDRRYLRCLGQPALFSPLGELVRFRTRKHLGLLVYLAVEGRSVHRRDRLAELLWPRVSLGEARHSLATALSVLRPRLGDGALVTDRETVTLSPKTLRLDLERLLSGDILGSDHSAPLEVSAFLDGFDIADSSEFALWKDRQQARFLPAIKEALVVLIDRCRRTGASRQIEHLADRMLALDELSEEAIRAKMEARALAGDRLTALQIFEEWKTKLGRELGASPSELVEGIAIRLRRRGWERARLTHIPSVPTDQWRGRSFIGRATEYQVLYEAWEGLRAGTAGHAMVLGDSGVGKTTLVGRFTTAAGLEGATISRAQCYDLEREIPYATLGHLIHGVLERPGVSATAPEALAELARTFPEVKRRFPSIPSANESQGETARLRLTEAFHQLLLSLVEEHPVILVIDDLHLADHASIAVLHLVLRRVSGHPVMAVLIARSAELSLSSQASRLRESANTLGIRTIELAPMSQEETQLLLRSLLEDSDPQPSASMRRALARAANGFPMVLELLVQDWRKGGGKSLTLTMDAMTAEPTIGSGSASLYREVLERTTRTLDLIAQNVLHLAAVSGHRLNDLRLYSIADLTLGQTMAGLSALAGARILRDNGRELEFGNELLRTAAYLAVPSPLRRSLHSRLADFLIDDAAHGAASLGLEIAWHCVRAGRAPEALAYLLDGAREAMVKGALDSAERALSTAIPHLEVPERERAILLLAEVLQEQGRWKESARVLCDCTGRADPSVMTVLRILAEHRTATNTPEHIRSDIQVLRSVAEHATLQEVRFKAIRVASKLMPDLRDEALSAELVEALTTIDTSSFDEEEVLRFEVTTAQLLYHAGNRTESRSHLLRTLDRTHRRGAINSTLAEAYTGLGAVGCHEGRYHEASNDFQKAYSVCARLGNEASQTSIASQIALCCGRLGLYDEQIEWSKKAAPLAIDSALGYHRLQPVYYESFALAMKGESRAALERMRDLELDSQSFSSPWLLQAWGLAKSDIHYLCGFHSAALTMAEEATHSPTPKLHATSFAGAFARWLALLSRNARIDRGTALVQLQSLRCDLDRLDALDQVEVLSAVAMVGGIDNDGLVESIAKRITVLPSATMHQMTRLGLAVSIPMGA